MDQPGSRTLIRGNQPAADRTRESPPPGTAPRSSGRRGRDRQGHRDRPVAWELW